MFNRYVNEVYYRGYHVLTLNEKLPASMWDDVAVLLDELEEGTTSAEALAEIQQEHAAQLADVETERDELQKRVDALQEQLDALDLDSEAPISTRLLDMQADVDKWHELAVQLERKVNCAEQTRRITKRRRASNQ